MQPCVELAPPVELVPSAGGAQDPDRLSVSPKHPLQIVARARAFLQRLVDSVGLLLVGRQQASIPRSEEHTSELQSRLHLVCRLLLEKKKKKIILPN